MNRDDGSREYTRSVLWGMDNMGECLDCFRTRVSPGLSQDEKESLMWCIYDSGLTERPLHRVYSPSTFPELDKYWDKDVVSGFELMVVEGSLFGELRKKQGQVGAR